MSAQPPPTDAERAKVAELLKTLVGTPKKTLDAEPYMLAYRQREPDGEITTTWWHAGSEEELREMELFYQAATKSGAFAEPIPPGEPVPRDPEELALIRAVLANRDDKTGYLVYADYLSERGNTQGDQLRDAINFERFGARDDPDEDRSDELWNNYWDRLERHAEEWLAPLTALGLRPEVEGEFCPTDWVSRGIIEAVAIQRPGILPEQADRLFAAAPLLCDVMFYAECFDPRALELPQFDQLDGLKFTGANLTPEQLTAVLACKHLGSLRGLWLGVNALLDDTCARALARWPGLARLRELDVSITAFTDAGVAALANSPRIANLRTLEAGNTGITSLAPLLRGKHIGALERLVYHAAGLDPEAAGLFARFERLRELELVTTTFEPGAFAALCACPLPALQRLRVADTRGGELHAADAEALAAAPFARHVRELNFEETVFAPGALAGLARCAFPALTDLNLSICLHEPGAILPLVAVGDRFPALKRLSLPATSLTPADATALADSPLLRNVTFLDVRRNKIGLKGARALAKSPHLGALRALQVWREDVGEKGLHVLLDRFGEQVVEVFE